MGRVGVRELKIHASEIVRRVREDGETFELTYRGETIGRIVPTGPKCDREAIQDSWREWEMLFEDIAANVVDDATLEETMREVRRAL